MKSYYAIRIALLIAPALGLSACQSTPDNDAVEPAPIAIIEPEPAAPRTYLHIGEARYPSLYSANSSAVWLTNAVAQNRLQAAIDRGEAVDQYLTTAAQEIHARYYVFEFVLESMFSDTSIAYDAVGLRNMRLYLRTPNGERVYPIQRIMNSHADQEQRDALTLFRRLNLVIFPKVDVITGSDSIAPGAAAVQLVIEGHDSEFYFEWPLAEQDSGVAMASGDSDQPGLSFQDLYSKLQFLVTRLK